jgi:hypothetical protein
MSQESDDLVAGHFDCECDEEKCLVAGSWKFYPEKVQKRFSASWLSYYANRAVNVSQRLLPVTPFQLRIYYLRPDKST